MCRLSKIITSKNKSKSEGSTRARGRVRESKSISRTKSNEIIKSKNNEIYLFTFLQGSWYDNHDSKKCLRID